MQYETPAPIQQPTYLVQPGPAAPVVPYQQAAAVPVAGQTVHPTVVQAAPAPVPLGSDPWPMRLLCGGIGVGVASIGISFVLQAIAAATTGLAIMLGILALVWLLRAGSGRGAGQGVNVDIRIDNRR